MKFNPAESMHPHKTCMDCRYYIGNPQNVQKGNCYQKPPVSEIISENGRTSLVSLRPTVAYNDIACGKFRERHTHDHTAHPTV
jgi:hypothetical protein